MLTVKLLALELGALLIYAGVTGRSVGRLLRGDNTVKVGNTQLDTGITPTSTTSVPTPTGTATASGYQTAPQLH